MDCVQAACVLSLKHAIMTGACGCAAMQPCSCLCRFVHRSQSAARQNLSQAPLHCFCRWQASSKGQRLVPVLLACGIKPDEPGEYNITFSVTSSSGLSASVNRRLTIKAACPPGEKLCSDKASASSATACAAQHDVVTTLLDVPVARCVVACRLIWGCRRA